ncbi:MAG: hypothetical protein OES12_10090, partial [Anaerolineae bacterium]|nr:hypothetical protein [Anaerolineae bacterium]
MKQRLFWLLSVLSVLALVLVACGGAAPQEAQEQGEGAAQEAAEQVEEAAPAAEEAMAEEA